MINSTSVVSSVTIRRLLKGGRIIHLRRLVASTDSLSKKRLEMKSTLVPYPKQSQAPVCKVFYA